MYCRRLYQMKEKERGASRINCNVISEPLLGTQGTFGLVTRECLELPKFFPACYVTF